MSNKTTIIVSDIHLGSAHLDTSRFNRFLDSLPEGCRLILNGDTLDSVKRPLPPEHQLLMERLHPNNPERETIWVEGNHDQRMAMRQHWQLPVCASLRLKEPEEIIIIHGAEFDLLGNGLRHAISFFRWLHLTRTRLGLTEIHFSEYAQSWRLPYWLMRFFIRFNAVRYARRQAASVVVCGHMHRAEDKREKAIRYINTGSWLGQQCHYLEIHTGNLTLRRWRDKVSSFGGAENGK